MRARSPAARALARTRRWLHQAPPPPARRRTRPHLSAACRTRRGGPIVLSRDTRNEKKLKAIRRAEFALKQRLERIDWEEDTLLPEISEFKAKAQLPEL